MKTFIKLVVCSFLIFLAVSGLAIPSADAAGLINSDYCKGHADGDYKYPTDCTKFISCSNEFTYVMPCADCNSAVDGSDRCPDGKLHFSEEVRRCEWADVANCAGETSFFNNPLKSTVMGSIPTTENWGNRCRL